MVLLGLLLLLLLFLMLLLMLLLMVVAAVRVLVGCCCRSCRRAPSIGVLRVAAAMAIAAAAAVPIAAAVAAAHEPPLRLARRLLALRAPRLERRVEQRARQHLADERVEAAVEAHLAVLKGVGAEQRAARGAGVVLAADRDARLEAVVAHCMCVWCV